MLIASVFLFFLSQIESRLPEIFNNFPMDYIISILYLRKAPTITNESIIIK